ncbi:hypothetical protein GCM10010168_86190 [Actinoplanes ianthinogenes]|uniref:Uncharacterized protein n=1 Tax=Actinoplanes ianthinogenes TaxID=122358 RepID=A0ABM7M1D4_9ACTN|nr:hypothetical protein [Actinoplanes ianthinogenes]BCJ45350.1 hypothetical protein Aiant_60070 [Actinoplanes ianthinogenes]GGR53949.1 hypothetical protein GCM10010168_86190 [Actinoplanes ianthinogenes]
MLDRLRRAIRPIFRHADGTLIIPDSALYAAIDAQLRMVAKIPADQRTQADWDYADRMLLDRLAVGQPRPAPLVRPAVPVISGRS